MGRNRRVGVPKSVRREKNRQASQRTRERRKAIKEIYQAAFLDVSRLRKSPSLYKEVQNVVHDTLDLLERLGEPVHSLHSNPSDSGRGGDKGTELSQFMHRDFYPVAREAKREECNANECGPYTPCNDEFWMLDPQTLCGAADEYCTDDEGHWLVI